MNYEGNQPRVLFVCSAGLLRSPTAAIVTQREWGWNTRAAGSETYALIPVTAVLIQWADRIICMENEHRTRLNNVFAGYHMLERCEVLGIPDDYPRMDPALIALILDALRIKASTNVIWGMPENQ